MKLTEILEGLNPTCLQGDKDVDIHTLVYDSRRAAEGCAFFCIRGVKTDGHLFAKKAAEQGAAIVCEALPDGLPKTATVIQVADTRIAMALAAANFYDHPTQKLNLVGVTGTNGKTTTTYLLKSILEDAGHKTGIIGTIENRIGNRVLHTERTTPESVDLQSLLRQMVQAGVSDVLMEVSSHALDLHRVDGCNYEIGIFTNLTQDHLDFHGTMENYREAKSQLFRRCNKAVINVDDAAGAYMQSVAKGKVLTFGMDKEADLKAEDAHITANGVTFRLVYQGASYDVKLNIPGKFSIYNALGAIGACIHMGIPMDVILQGLAENKGVPGRFQTIQGHTGFNAIVDYAHTPDGLENILNTAKEFVKGRIITVFGCGGDRDRTKRPVMGEIAGKLSDYCIITSDNPRTENPDLILLDIEIGMQRTKCAYEKQVDRRKAIFAAVAMAHKGDVVVIAGKGHEDYQIFADKTIHFDDAEVVREALGETK